MQYLDEFQHFNQKYPDIHINLANKALVVEGVVYDFAMNRIGQIPLNESVNNALLEGTVGDMWDSATDFAKGAVKWAANTAWATIKPPTVGLSGDGWKEWAHWLAGVTSLALTLTGVGIGVATAIDIVDGGLYIVEGINAFSSANWLSPIGDIMIGGITIGLSFMGGRLASGTIKKTIKTEVKGLIPTIKSLTKDTVITKILGSGNRGKSFQGFLTSIENKSLMGKIGSAFKTFYKFISEVTIFKPFLGTINKVIKKCIDFLSGSLDKIKGMFKGNKGVSWFTSKAVIQDEARALLLNPKLTSLIGHDTMKTLVDSFKGKSMKGIGQFLLDLESSGQAAKFMSAFKDSKSTVAFLKQVSAMSPTGLKNMTEIVKGSNVHNIKALINIDASLLKQVSKLEPANVAAFLRKQSNTVPGAMANIKIMLGGTANIASKAELSKVADIMTLRKAVAGTGTGKALSPIMKSGREAVEKCLKELPKATPGKLLDTKVFKALAESEQIAMKEYLTTQIMPYVFTTAKKMNFASAEVLMRNNKAGVLFFEGIAYHGKDLEKGIIKARNVKGGKFTLISLALRNTDKSQFESWSTDMFSWLSKLNPDTSTTIEEPSAIFIPEPTGLEMGTLSDIAYDESGEPTEEIQSEENEGSPETALSLVGDYLKDDHEWYALFREDDLKDDEGNIMPTDVDGYDTETEEGTINAIKLYQCLIKQEGNDIRVDGIPDSVFMMYLLRRLKAKASEDSEYEHIYKNAKELRIALDKIS